MLVFYPVLFHYFFFFLYSKNKNSLRRHDDKTNDKEMLFRCLPFAIIAMIFLLHIAESVNLTSIDALNADVKEEADKNNERLFTINGNIDRDLAPLEARKKKLLNGIKGKNEDIFFSYEKEDVNETTAK